MQTEKHFETIPSFAAVAGTYATQKQRTAYNSLTGLMKESNMSTTQQLTYSIVCGLVVGRRTCDLRVAGSRPGRDAAAQHP